MILATIIGAATFFVAGFVAGMFACGKCVAWTLHYEGEHEALEKLRS